MKTKLKFVLFLILILSAGRIMSQTDDDKKGNTSDVSTVKAIMSNLPKEMNAGSTADVNVTITNKSTTKSWSSGTLKTEVTGPFKVDRLDKSDFTLSPGESKVIPFKVYAPNDIGKHRLTVLFYNNNKKIGKKSKVIKVLSLTK